MSEKDFIEVFDRSQLNSGALEKLLGGRILVLRSMPEMPILREKILNEIANTGGGLEEQELRGFFEDHHKNISVEAVAVMTHCLKKIRDSRFISCLFQEAIARLELPAPVLVETGHFRVVLPDSLEQCKQRKDLFDSEDYTSKGPHEPEVMLTGGPGYPHRDLNNVHSHVQLNFWCPLHEVTAPETLWLFPDCYHKDLPYYCPPENWDDPSTTPYGRCVQVPLKFGDGILFHSQMMHGSPMQSPIRNRISLEFRAAADCMDSNFAYRRTFAQLENYTLRDGHVETKEPLATNMPLIKIEQAAHRVLRAPSITASVRENFERFLSSAQTPIEVISGLFVSADWARRALDPYAPDFVFSKVATLNSHSCSLLAQWNSTSPFCEDRSIAVARILARNGERELALSVLDSLINNTASFSWAHEAVRHVICMGERAVAASYLDHVIELCRNSDLELGRYSKDVPATFYAGRLLPPHGIRAAEFLKKALPDAQSGGRPVPTEFLDYRLFIFSLTMEQSFENANIFHVHGVWLALPHGKPLVPEYLAMHPKDVAICATEEELACIPIELGEKIECENYANLSLIVNSFFGSNIIMFYGTFVVIPQTGGDYNPFIDAITDVERAVIAGSLEDAQRFAQYAELDNRLATGNKVDVAEKEIFGSLIDSPIVSSNYLGFGYNVIRHRERYYVLSCDSGPVDLETMADPAVAIACHESDQLYQALHQIMMLSE